ncbi:MAG TPA: cytochrome c biogenesis protein CcmE [Elusimicrobia bacterium]|nr:cytochrome c biogenesis protein CcmE [Elusimicrobiota bacterium]
MKKKKFVIGGLIILGVVGYLVYSGIRDLGVYYFTVSELKEKKVYNQGVRVGGKIAPGTVVYDAANLKLNFGLTDGKEEIKVYYKGIVPDAFKEDNEVLVEGKYSADGLFTAATLLAKCPSKYKAKVTAP